MRRIVALTGAGISQASGIPTYEEAPELRKLFTIDAWDRDPQKWLKQYQPIHARIQRAMPNDAHEILVEYEIPVITQNIDRLHAEAGTPSKELVELHGRYDLFICTTCGKWGHDLTQTCYRCGKDTMRPNIVLYGEPILHYGVAADFIYHADVLLVVGTSLITYPANTLVSLAQHRGMDVITVNNNAEKRLPDILEVLTTT